MTSVQAFIERYCRATVGVLSCIDASLANDAEVVALFSLLALNGGDIHDSSPDLLHDYILPVAREVCAARVKAQR